MSRLLWSATMSLDGFIAGPGGSMRWLGEHAARAAASGESGPEPDVEGLMADIGALLVGRRTFTGDDPNGRTDDDGAFDGLWQGPQVVLTRDRGFEPRWPDVVVSHDLHEAVGLARAAAGGRYVNVLGADVARQCLEAGLLDEVLVFVVPVLLGDGVRLFDHPGGHEVHLEPVSHRPMPGGLWFRVPAPADRG